MARRNRAIPEINAGSMADIAFLLLIFFLVTASMDSDSGITINLPPWEEPNTEQKGSSFYERNVFEILVNANNQLLVEGELVQIEELRSLCEKFITNEGKDPNLSVNPQKAIISLKCDRGTGYKVYIAIQNELKAAYREVREDYAMARFGRKLENLNPDQKKDVLRKYPQKISEAEPENTGGTN